MGQTLSEPVTTKNTASCRNGRFRVGSSSMQGWRVNMEDSHTHILSLHDDPEAAFFGVFDGHGGAKVAEYAGRHLHKFVTRRTEYAAGDVAEAMRRGFLECDAAMADDEQLKLEQSGSTAIVCLTKQERLYCANVGDSRAVASVGGRAEPLSTDHKPSNPEEYARITNAGGFVEFNRVNGNLALSRAFGDFIFKKNDDKGPQEQIVIAYPEVKVCEITADWEFIVLACDGIWDVMSNEEVVDVVRKHIAAGVEPELICEKLMMDCLAPDSQMAGLGCDNMTVVIVGLVHDDSYEELTQKCARNVINAQVAGTTPQSDADDNDNEFDKSGDGAAENDATTCAATSQQHQHQSDTSPETVASSK